MAQSKIEWTDETWNPVTGCTKVSAGCKNCYAETIANRFWGNRKFTDIICHEDRLDQPAKWKKPRRVFVNSMSDLFHEDVPFEFIDRVFHSMANTKHTFQILTKRPERMNDYFSEARIHPLHNVWLGVSVEGAEQINRIESLVKIPAVVRFVSFEPLLSWIDMYSELSERQIDWTKIHWAIIGCESGQKKRECKLDWVYDLAQDLQFMNIKIFVKQLNINGKVEKDISKFPKNLQIREYPNG